MKLTFETVMVVAILTAGIYGCSTVERTVYDQEVVPVTNSAGAVSLQTNLVIKPAVQTGVDVVGAVPHPYAAIGSAVVGWALWGYAAWRNSRNKKAAKAVIAGTQAYKKTLGEKEREKLVAALVDAQAASGVRPDVNELRGK